MGTVQTPAGSSVSFNCSYMFETFGIATVSINGSSIRIPIAEQYPHYLERITTDSYLNAFVEVYARKRSTRQEGSMRKALRQTSKNATHGVVDLRSADLLPGAQSPPPRIQNITMALNQLFPPSALQMLDEETPSSLGNCNYGTMNCHEQHQCRKLFLHGPQRQCHRP